MNIEAMCIEAQKRVQRHINHSAGQHIRALKSPPPTAPTADQLYAICMESDTADEHAVWLYMAAGHPLPSFIKEARS